MDEVSKMIGSQVKKARTDKHLTQQQLADILQKTRSAVVDIEAGRRQLNVKNLLTLSEILDKPMCFFVNCSKSCTLYQKQIKTLKEKIDEFSQGSSLT